jgi:predicted RND superfamily exporter protein
MKHTFFSRMALPILLLVAFLVPFSLRGARVAVEGMKNDVKDWLPDDFPETRELDWFRQHFLGDTFVLITWEGCTEDDPRYKMLVGKLQEEIHLSHEFAPLATNEVTGEPNQEITLVANRLEGGDRFAPEKLAIDERLRARKLGNDLFLTVSTDMHENWGGRQEKWIHGHKGAWYFITPQGELYEWDGGSNLVSAMKRVAKKWWAGKDVATGRLVTELGLPPTADTPNEYYADPRKVCATLFKGIASGPEAVKQLSREGGPLLQGDVSEEMAKEKAIKRLSGSLFGPDGKQTCLILALDNVARRDLKRVAGHGTMGTPKGRLLEIATTQCGLSMDELRMGGPAVDNVAIDEEGQSTLINLIGWSAVIGLVISYISFRSFKVTGLVFFTGGVSAVSSLAIVYWGFNDSPDAVLMSMPSLVYVMGLAGAVHVINYYRDAVIEGGYQSAPERALKHSFLPCFLCNFTTALGLISLLTSNITPIRKFGFYSALGVMSTLFLLYLFLPAALQLWPIKFKIKSKEDRSKEDEHSYLQNMAIWRPYVTWIGKRWAGVLTACLLLFFGLGYGCFLIKTDVQLLKMFHKDARIIADYRWMETNLGKLVPVELVVRVDPAMVRPIRNEAAVDQSAIVKEQFQYNFLERMEICDHIQRSLADVFGKEGADMLGPGLSAATFGPDLPGPSGNWRSIRGTMSRKLEENRDEFLKTDYLRIDRAPGHEGSELWRVSLRLNAMDVDYGAFIGDLKRAVEPVMYAYHYRDQILNSISEQRGGAGFRKSGEFDAPKILIVGASNPRAKETTAEGAAPRAAKPVAKAGQVVVDEKKIFTSTLCDLLINAGTRAVWLDNSSSNFAEATEANKLAAYDCVVVVDGGVGFNIAQAKDATKALVDAQAHGYIADDQLPKSVKQQTTEAARRGDPISVIYTGVVPVVYKAQRTLLESLIESFAWTFVTVALVMMILLRDWQGGGWGIGNWLNFRGGFMAMLPNLFPIALVFGFIGWRGILVDIGTMMTASIALGIAVDDTVHFLEWFRSAYMRGMNRVEATLDAFGRVGTAMIQTACVGGLGLSVFALSSFTPTQRFGTMMLLMLFVALFGELVMMPALLASPLGKYFVPKRCWHRGPSKESAGDPTPEKAPASDVVAASATSTTVPAPHTGTGGVRVGSAVRYVRRDKPHN